MRRREFNASLLIASAAIQPALAQLPEKRRTIAIVVSLLKGLKPSARLDQAFGVPSLGSWAV